MSSDVKTTEEVMDGKSDIWTKMSNLMKHPTIPGLFTPMSKRSLQRQKKALEKKIRLPKEDKKIPLTAPWIPQTFNEVLPSEADTDDVDEVLTPCEITLTKKEAKSERYEMRKLRKRLRKLMDRDDNDDAEDDSHEEEDFNLVNALRTVQKVVRTAATSNWTKEWLDKEREERNNSSCQETSGKKKTRKSKRCKKSKKGRRMFGKGTKSKRRNGFRKTFESNKKVQVL